MNVIAPRAIADTCDLDLDAYDVIIVAFSGGKDSLAVVLHLLDLGVPPGKIELWHHEVDGGNAFMDWPITPEYCRAVARHLGIKLYFSWKEGGFHREMMRDNTATAPVWFDTPDAGAQRAGGESTNLSTRKRFPQVSSDLSVRWCSAYLKIDVMSIALRNQARFNGMRTLVVTGERAQESPGRARYATFERHRADLRDGRRPRHIDHWRPVHGWDERAVWDVIRRHGVVPHPAYYLGWGRLSCMKCIFGSPNQWATIQHIDPEGFEQIACLEEAFDVTIQRKRSVRQLAARGTPYQAALDNPALVKIAMSKTWQGDLQDIYPAAVFLVWIAPDQWPLPAGAFGENAGPT